MYNGNAENMDKGHVMLKLFYASASPYARKVRVLISEKGIESSVALQSCLPFEKPVDLVALNPLSKVPCLVLEDGTALYDSPFICEYLDQLSAPELLPPSGQDRWVTLGRQALADGILDAGVSVRLESLRAETERSPAWITRQTEVVDRSLNSFEGAIASRWRISRSVVRWAGSISECQITTGAKTDRSFPVGSAKSRRDPR